MNVNELIVAAKQEFENSDNPNDVFRLYEEVLKLSQTDLEKFRRSGYSEALAMSYITAAAMKEEDTWDSYVEKCKNKKRKTAEEIKKELMEKYLSV